MMTFKGIESGRLTGTVQVLFEPKATDGYLIRGFLVKQGGARKTWKRRWFRLDAHGTLSYYSSQTVRTRSHSMSLGLSLSVSVCLLAELTWRRTHRMRNLSRAST